VKLAGLFRQEAASTPRPVVVLDIESTGTGPSDQPWEFACCVIRDGQKTWHEFFIEHDKRKAASLPDRFREDHDARFRPEDALSRRDAAWNVQVITRDAMIVGSAPWFDMGLLEPMLREAALTPQWSHRLRCVGTMAHGFLGRSVGGLAGVCEVLGVPLVDAHTAGGDVRATVRCFELLTGPRWRLRVAIWWARVRRLIRGAK
jgi:DNA polymerase III epsilon subunit-like protein